VTDAKDRKDQPRAEVERPPRKRNDGHELDAEVVKDLEVDDQANEIAGGNMPSGMIACGAQR